MANQKGITKEEYIERYADIAMEQMTKYGIPASITLAQGIIESGYGNSHLCEYYNNHFGIKAHGRPNYVVRADDKPDDKFRVYANAEESFEDHSKFLQQRRYTSQTSHLAKDDYAGWARVLEKKKYATAADYANTLIKEIKKYNLAKYDQMVLSGQYQANRGHGAVQGPGQGQQLVPTTDMTAIIGSSKTYSLPMAAQNGGYMIKSKYGMRNHPFDGAYKMHKGIDIHPGHSHTQVYATEDSGKVIKVDTVGNGAAGKHVTVEYQRADGSTVQCTYMHLSQVNVALGETVNAGVALGLTGNTGRSTGEHLHFQVDTVKDGEKKSMDPVRYLAAMDLATGRDTQMVYMSHDLAAAEKATLATDAAQQQQYLAQSQQQISAKEQIEKFMSDNDPNKQQEDDYITELFVKLFESIQAITAFTEMQEQQKLSEVIENKHLDLTEYLQGQYKSVCLDVGTDGKPVLTIDDGTNKQQHVMTRDELHNYNSLVANITDKKQLASNLNNFVQGLSWSELASMNYDQIEQQQQKQQQQQMTASR